MANDDNFLLKTVDEAYSNVAKTGCSPHYADTVAQSFGYTVEQLEAIPADSHMGLGCGNPTVTATLKPGETVLDLGSGGGIDILLAALKIGPHGKAVGLDMSSEMVKRARNNATKRALFPPQVSFVQSLLTEALPINTNSVDCVLSNCVINLLPQSGKNHIFKEIFRVLKPGGRLVLDDILAKEELPAHIRNDMQQYVSCIGGTIQVHEYQELLDLAGFKDSIFVDSRADLNIYIAAADVDSAPSCCGSGPATTTAAANGNTVDIDLNRWAASYQIYARKPEEADVLVCDSPLTRWWDAFPAAMVTNISKISPVQLADLLKGNGSVAVIDVRDVDEYSKGHVNRNWHFPAQTFYMQLSAFHAQLANMESVVFYCGETTERAPRCAEWYRDFLDAGQLSQPKVFILDGGFHRWVKDHAHLTPTMRI
ncbi:S-adenosyl-L-methionine-dependent methyltransferase [Mycena crocata]|nr:S-adenosyl-L-methionine-dependent methyltransferase [Mycena crocata]